MGALSQRKGKAFERYVAGQVNTVPGWQAEHRIPQSGGGGKNNPDVRADLGDLHLHIECNHSKAPPVPTKWRQARRDCGPHADPVVWVRYGQTAVGETAPEIVCVSWDWLIQVPPPTWIWPAAAGNARAALDKATRTTWVGCTPIGACVVGVERLAVMSPESFLHMLREISIDRRD